MPYSRTYKLSLGAQHAGLAHDMAARYQRYTGEDEGDPVTTGFREIGPGDYAWTVEFDTRLDYVRGWVRFERASTGEYLGSLALNPEDYAAVRTLQAIGGLSPQLAQIDEDVSDTVPSIVAALSGHPIHLTQAVAQTGDLTLVRGDAYPPGRAGGPVWTLTGPDPIAGRPVVLLLDPPGHLQRTPVALDTLVTRLPDPSGDTTRDRTMIRPAGLTANVTRALDGRGWTYRLVAAPDDDTSRKLLAHGPVFLR